MVRPSGLEGSYRAQREARNDLNIDTFLKTEIFLFQINYKACDLNAAEDEDIQQFCSLPSIPPTLGQEHQEVVSVWCRKKCNQSRL